MSFVIKHFGLKETIFVPTTIVFDADFRITRVALEGELKSRPAGMFDGPRLEVTLPFTESQKGERFVLVFTGAAGLGNRLKREGDQRVVLSSADLGGAIADLFIHLDRASDGTIQAEAKPEK